MTPLPLEYAVLQKITFSELRVFVRFYLRGIKFCCEINQHAMVSFSTDNLSVRIKVGVAPQPRLLPPKWPIDFHATTHFFKHDIVPYYSFDHRKIW